MAAIAPSAVLTMVFSNATIEREERHLHERERRGHREVLVAEKILEDDVEVAEDAGRVEHDPEEDRRDDQDDAERDRQQEGKLHRRPEVDVDQLEADLLAY